MKRKGEGLGERWLDGVLRLWLRLMAWRLCLASFVCSGFGCPISVARMVKGGLLHILRSKCLHMLLRLNVGLDELGLNKLDLQMRLGLSLWLG